jgi:hypothetical protein
LLGAPSSLGNRARHVRTAIDPPDRRKIAAEPGHGSDGELNFPNGAVLAHQPAIFNVCIGPPSTAFTALEDGHADDGTWARRG